MAGQGSRLLDIFMELPGVDSPGVDLPGVDSPGVDSPGADLRSAVLRGFQGQVREVGEMSHFSAGQCLIPLHAEVAQIRQSTQRHQAAQPVAIQVQLMKPGQSRQWRQVGYRIAREFKPGQSGECIQPLQACHARMAAVQVGELDRRGDRTIANMLFHALAQRGIRDIVLGEKRGRRVNHFLVNGKLVVSTGRYQQQAQSGQTGVAHGDDLRDGRRSPEASFDTIMAVIPDNKK